MSYLLKIHLHIYKVTYELLQMILLEIQLLLNNCPLTDIDTDSTECFIAR